MPFVFAPEYTVRCESCRKRITVTLPMAYADHDEDITEYVALRAEVMLTLHAENSK